LNEEYFWFSADVSLIGIKKIWELAGDAAVLQCRTAMQVALCAAASSNSILYISSPDGRDTAENPMQQAWITFWKGLRQCKRKTLLFLSAKQFSFFVSR
jgi:hypothetical protein